MAGAGVQLQREEDATLFVIGHQRSLRENDSPSDEDVRILHNRRKSLLILIDTFYGVNLCCFGVIFPFLLCFKYIQLFVSLISAHARSMC